MNIRTELQNTVPGLAKIGIEFFGSYRNKSAKNALKKHDHGPCYEICYLESGSQPYYIHKENGEVLSFDVGGGDIFITRPYEVHSTGDFRQLRGDLKWIQLNTLCPTLLGQNEMRSEMLKNALASIEKHHFKVPRSVSSRLSEAFDLLLVPNDGNFFKATELLTLFILELAEASGHDDGGNNSAVTVEAIAFIKSHLLSPELNVDSVASKMNYSRSFAMRVFKRETGIPIHEFILKSRIELSTLLLKDHTVTETAMLLNFSSSQHFSEVFKQFTGTSPAKYKKTPAK